MALNKKIILHFRMCRNIIRSDCTTRILCTNLQEAASLQKQRNGMRHLGNQAAYASNIGRDVKEQSQESVDHIREE